MSPEQTPEQTAVQTAVQAADQTAAGTAAQSNAGQDAEQTAEQAAEQRPATSWRRTLAVTLLLSVVGATLLLVASGQTWVSGTVQAQGATRTVTAHGSEVSGVPGAMALVALASVVAVFAVRGTARRVLGGLVTLAGAGAVFAATAALGSETGALDEKAARSVGLTDVTVGSVTHSAWPWIAALGGLLVVVAGVLTTLRGAAWPGMSARYDAPAGKRSAAGPRGGSSATASAGQSSPADLWKALDRGEDPTAS
ncbi:TIGR02234 family membrane protein [Streptacidiphilus anmyonensis]|uniref:TIGR02234 family membrane protein n=1 Tax=Streptacidiphilus anmyonensis TaxID=405782 RepID=UPI000A0011F3|nr:TIGR02234 family membrane protein [Streptacidiphilus anmyonensis]